MVLVFFPHDVDRACLLSCQTFASHNSEKMEETKKWLMCRISSDEMRLVSANKSVRVFHHVHEFRRPFLCRLAICSVNIKLVNLFTYIF